MKASEKNRIRTIAQEIKETNECYLEMGETRIEKSWITCIREAINYQEPKQSNKLADRMANYHESRNERYDYRTKSYRRY